MPRVLIVDDEWGIRSTLREFLIEENYEVETAAEAEEAERFLEHQPFDVIVTDIIMPRSSGVDLLAVIRERNPGAQVILITGEPMVDTATQALRGGAFDYLQKPITRQHIVNVVAKAARVKMLLDEKDRLEQENRSYRDSLEKIVDERTKALLESEELHLALVQNMPCGFAYFRVLKDERPPHDLRFLELNPPFLKIMGLGEKDPVGQSYAETIHEGGAPATRLLSRLLAVARDGQAEKFTHHFAPLSRWLRVVAYPPRPDYLVTILDDISPEIEQIEALKKRLRELEGSEK